MSEHKKRCVRCRSWLSPDEFYANRARESGRRDECKDCTRAIRAKPSEDLAERKRRTSRAKGRAHRRLEKMYPEMFDRIYREELEAVGVQPAWTKSKQRADAGIARSITRRISEQG